RRRHTRFSRDWSSDVCSSDLVGNWISVMVVILAGDKLRKWLQGRKKSEKSEEKRQKRLERGQRLFNKYGVPGVSLLGPLFIGDRSEERRVGKDFRSRWATVTF